MPLLIQSRLESNVLPTHREKRDSPDLCMLLKISSPMR